MDFEKYSLYYIKEKENPNNYLRILGKEFIKNNKNKGKLIIDNKKYPFQEFVIIHGISEGEIKIKIILNGNSYNRSYMFKNCESLLEVLSLEEINCRDNSDNYDELEENKSVLNKKEQIEFSKGENNKSHLLYGTTEDYEILKNLEDKATDKSIESYFNNNLIFGKNNYY